MYSTPDTASSFEETAGIHRNGETVQQELVCRRLQQLRQVTGHWIKLSDKQTVDKAAGDPVWRHSEGLRPGCPPVQFSEDSRGSTRKHADLADKPVYWRSSESVQRGGSPGPTCRCCRQCRRIQ